MNDAQSQNSSEVVHIGSECFGLRDGSVLSWRGKNYVPQKPTLRVRIHNLWVGFLNRRR